MASVNVEITGDARQLEAAFTRIEQGQQKTEQGFANVADAGKASGATVATSFVGVGEAGRDSARQIESANEAAATKGAGSYNRLLAELRKHGPEGRAQAKAILEHMQATGKGGQRSMKNIVEELGTFDDVAATVAENAIKEFDGVADAGQQAFGAATTASLDQYIVKWKAVSEAINFAKKSIEAMRQAQQDAVDSLEARQDPNRRLLQVTNTTEEFKEAQATADRLAGTYGIGRDEARELGFSAISAGFKEDQDFIARNAPILGIDSQAKVAGLATKTFDAEGVNVDQAINATLAAAAESIFNFEELAAGLPKLASRAKEAGSGFDETLALISSVADNLQNVDRAADRLGAFASAVSLDKGAEAETEDQFAARVKAEEFRARKANLDYEETKERAAAAKQELATNEQPEKEARLQRKVEDAQLRLDGFDTTTLTPQKLERREGRRSLAGMGILEAERVLTDEYTEEQRNDFLGANMALNEAVVAIRDTRETSTARKETIASARADAGTERSLVAQKQQAFAGDLPSVLAQEKRAEDNRVEIERENALAAPEMQRQGKRARQKADEYKRGDSSVVVEARAFGRATSDFMADVADGGAKALFGWDRYDGLELDAQTAIEQSEYSEDDNRKLEAIAFAARQLGSRKKASPSEEAILSQTDVQSFLQMVKGEAVPAEQITDQHRIALTNQIRRLAYGEHATAGALQKAAFNLIPGLNAHSAGLNSSRPSQLLDAVNYSPVLASVQSSGIPNSSQQSDRSVDSAGNAQTGFVPDGTRNSQSVTAIDPSERLAVTAVDSAGNAQTGFVPDGTLSSQSVTAPEPSERLAVTAVGSAGNAQTGFVPDGTLNSQSVTAPEPSERLSVTAAEPHGHGQPIGPVVPITEETNREILAEIRETNRIARENAEIARDYGKAAKETAANTKPRPAQSNPAETIRAATVANDARAPR